MGYGVVIKLIKVAICDDMNIDRHCLVSLVSELLDKRRLKYCIYQFSSGEELLAEQLMFDIIFLDIQMPGIDGIEVAKRFYEAGSQAFLIFTTSYNEYIGEGYKVRAFRYLMKPVSRCDVEEAVNKILKIISEERILFKKNKTYYSIPQKDILYIESANGGRGVLIHTIKSKMADSRSMEEYDQLLSKSRFFRSHRCCYVNMEFIESYDKSSIFLKGGEQVWLSCKRHKRFVEAFDSYKWERGSR